MKLKHKKSDSKISPVAIVVDHPASDRELEFDFPEIVIQPSRGWKRLKLGDLWEYRELLFFLLYEISVYVTSKPYLGRLGLYLTAFIYHDRIQYLLRGIGKNPF